MSTDTTEPFDYARICPQPAHCPVCAAPNRCRLETGEAYKGPCWCERPTLSGAALRRILSDFPEPRCLCQGCLEAIAANPEITWDGLVARSRTDGGEAGMPPNCATTGAEIAQMVGKPADVGVEIRAPFQALGI